MPFEIDEYKLRESTKPKELTEKSKSVLDDFFETVIKWAVIIFFGVLIIGIAIFILGALFGILKFGWNQL